MKQYVVQLYSENWNQYQENVQAVVKNVDKAKEMVEALSKDSGWRERVAAAKIIATYHLAEYVPVLIKSFEQSPEYNTCCAFTKMIKVIFGKYGINYLIAMKNSCSKDARGQVMIDEIESTIGQLEST